MKKLFDIYKKVNSKIQLKYFFILLAIVLLKIFDFGFLLFLFCIYFDFIYMRFTMGLGKSIPFDFGYLGMFLISYFVGFKFGLYFIIYSFIIRILYQTYSPSYLLKIPILLTKQ